MNPRLAALSLCIFAELMGCQGRDPQNNSPAIDASTKATTKATPKSRASSDVYTHSPLSQKELPTTNGSIAISNLNGQIRATELMITQRPNDAFGKERMIELLGIRGQFLGIVADYERAYALAEELVKADPKSPSALLARARTRASLHQFKDAQDDLAMAEQQNASPEKVNSIRASILVGLGRYDEALPLLHKASTSSPSVQTLGSEAVVLGLMRRFDEAEKLFIEAPRHFRDVSAFPIAWLYFQEASMWERALKPERAHALLVAAVSRLPLYAHAVTHLAAMEPYARGIELLTPVTERADDPEPLSALADLLRKKGDSVAADAALTKAKARYEELTKAHPEAYADHAARFWLNLGGDPSKALALAKKNLDVRRTEDAFDLVLTTALAAGSHEDACKAANEGAKLLYPSEIFRKTAAEVSTTCH